MLKALTRGAAVLAIAGLLSPLAAASAHADQPSSTLTDKEKAEIAIRVIEALPILAHDGCVTLWHADEKSKLCTTGIILR